MSLKDGLDVGEPPLAGGYMRMVANGELEV